MSEQDHSAADAVVATARVAGPAGLVFNRWIDVDELNQWWWPMFTDATYQLDPQPGGSYRFQTIGGGFSVTGEYTVVEPGHRLEFTWQWRNLVDQVWLLDGGVDTIEVDFTADGPDRTLVRVRHHTTPEAVGDYTAGWRDVLSRLGVVDGSDPTAP